MHTQLHTLVIKNLILLLLCVTGMTKSYGQYGYGRVDIEVTQERKLRKISARVEINSPFRGGDSALVRSMERNLNQSVKGRNGVKKGKYIFSAAFIISKDGSISDVKCITDPGFGLCEDVLRVLKKTKTWTPATQPVNVRPYRGTQP